MPVRVGEIVAYASSPWEGDVRVRLDSGAYTKPDARSLFRFQGAAPGIHVLKTVAFGFEPQLDTVLLRRNEGVLVRITPRKRAIDVCTGPTQRE